MTFDIAFLCITTTHEQAGCIVQQGKPIVHYYRIVWDRIIYIQYSSWQHGVCILHLQTNLLVLLMIFACHLLF